jgi:hypothetical protein
MARRSQRKKGVASVRYFRLYRLKLPEQFILFGVAFGKTANQSVSLNEELFT